MLTGCSVYAVLLCWLFRLPMLIILAGCFASLLPILALWLCYLRWLILVAFLAGYLCWLCSLPGSAGEMSMLIIHVLFACCTKCICWLCMLFTLDGYAK
jgi:hypothetical protein